jgi:aryl-alcohol dehydrogenase-like predicted oxidoreductase
MASGLLTGAFSSARIASLPDDDWRKHAPQFNEPALAGNLAVAEVLNMVARSHGCSPGEAAIAWVLSNEAVHGAIVGFRNPAQVQGLASGAEVKLSEDELSLLDATTRQRSAR